MERLLHREHRNRHDMSGLILALLLAGAGRGYRIAPPLPKATVSCWGDSIFAGACGTQPCAALKDDHLPGAYAYATKAMSGEMADQIAHRIISEAATACLGEPCATYAVNGGVNTLKSADVAVTPDADTVAYALSGDGATVLGMLDGVDWIHATYPRANVILFGVLPYAGCDNATCPSLVNPGNRARLYNAAMLSACASRPWLRCLAPYSAFEDPQNPDHGNPSMVCADGIHWQSAGGHLIGDYLYAAGASP